MSNISRAIDDIPTIPFLTKSQVGMMMVIRGDARPLASSPPQWHSVVLFTFPFLSFTKYNIAHLVGQTCIKILVNADTQVSKTGLPPLISHTDESRSSLWLSDLT